MTKENAYLGSIAAQPNSDASRIIQRDDMFDEESTKPSHTPQLPLDLIDEASMESFPCSDPPCYSHCHA